MILVPFNDMEESLVPKLRVKVRKSMSYMYGFDFAGKNTGVTVSTTSTERVLTSITLPGSLFEEAAVIDSSDGDSVGLVFTFFEDATLFPLPSETPPDLSIQSPVIGALLGAVPTITDLTEPIVITLHLRATTDNVTVSYFIMPLLRNKTFNVNAQEERVQSVDCVSWDFEALGKAYSSQW